MIISRREFLRTVAATAATASLAGHDWLAEAKELDPSMTWAKAPCRFCGVGCGTLVGVRGGRVEAVTGDPASSVNRGLLCAKGYHLPAVLAGADRLRFPMLREGDNYRRLSWDEALDLVAAKYKEALGKGGPESVAIFGSGQWTIPEGYAAQKWFKAGMRSNNIDSNARLCMTSAVQGFVTTFGSDEPMGCYDDIEHADVFVLWGNNMAEMHPILFSRMLARKKAAPGTRIFDLTTRRTQTSQYADAVLLMKPQGDLAIANGICRWLLANDKFDKEFVGEHCIFQKGKTDIGYALEDKFKFQDAPEEITLDAYRALVEPYTPEKVQELAGIAPEDLLKLAEAFGDPKAHVVSYWCMGVNQHTRGTWMNNLIYAVHLLSGKIGVPGSTPFSLTGQSSACGTVREVGTSSEGLPADRRVTDPEHRAQCEKLWNVPEGTINPKPGTHALEVFRGLCHGELKVVWVQVTNPFVTLPNMHRNRDGKKACRDDSFLIVSDIYPTPTTALADLILPSACWVEKDGAFGNAERRTQQWDKMIDGPGEAKSDLWQLVEVARRMGYGALFPETKTLAKDLFEDYRRFTVGIGKDVASWEDLRMAPGLQWPVVDGKETPRRYVPGHDPYAKKEGRIDFYKAKKTNHKAVIWARPYEPPPEVPDKDYPFWLSTGRVLEHWHTGSMTRRVPELHRAMPSAYCEMNQEDADELGIYAGDNVKLTSRRGSIVLRVALNEKSVPQKGHVFVPFFDENLLINELTLDAMCPISKQPDFKKCAVKVETA
ncbi:MAG: molybdopterin-dependent oxidoreductase [Planctomycetes bacterium]|nr:molybdopterin-dependent oxidoreductase [Planctomycetota bacterium]